MKGPSSRPSPPPSPPPPPPPFVGPGLVSSGPEVLRCGELEKRSASLFQLWKKKQVVLSRESLSLFPPEKKEAKAEEKAASWRRREGKALGLGSIAKVDCVERTGKYLYFTLVTTDHKEIDFRCPGGTGWNASIALALIDFQNQRALRRFRARRRNNGHGRRDPQEEEQGEGEGGGPPEEEEEEEGGKADARMDRAS